jgi:hypothetical protein
LVEQAQKFEPFLVPVALLTEAIDFAVGRIQRGEQGSRAVAFVVVGHGGAASAFQRQAGLGPIQSLNLALLVHAQHQRMFGRIQVQTDDVFQFLGERGIVADLERFYAMWFQTVGAPDAAHAGFADADSRRHRARAPVRGVAGLLARGHGHDALRQARTDRGFASGPGRVFQQPRHTQREKTLAPARNFFRRHEQADGNILVLSACGRQQHDASAFHHAQRERPAPGLGFQHRPLLRTQGNDWGYAHPQPSP